MHQDEDIQVVGTMTDYLIQKVTDKEEGKEFASEYFKSAFLSSAVNALFYMRRQAGLTQTQVAEQLNTKQSAIARLESDFDGGISLRRYVDFALACGMIPHNITFAPLESAVSYTVAQPKLLFTQVNHQDWLKVNAESTSERGAHAKSNIEAISESLQPQRNTLFSIETSVRRVPASSTVATSSATTLQDDLSTHEYFQPYLMKPFQLLHGGGKVNTASESQNKIPNLAPSKAS